MRGVRPRSNSARPSALRAMHLGRGASFLRRSEVIQADTVAWQAMPPRPPVMHDGQGGRQQQPCARRCGTCCRPWSLPARRARQEKSASGWVRNEWPGGVWKGDRQKNTAEREEPFRLFARPCNPRGTVEAASLSHGLSMLRLLVAAGILVLFVRIGFRKVKRDTDRDQAESPDTNGDKGYFHSLLLPSIKKATRQRTKPNSGIRMNTVQRSG